MTDQYKRIIEVHPDRVDALQGCKTSDIRIRIPSCGGPNEWVIIGDTKHRKAIDAIAYEFDFVD